jgi:putative transposase
MVKRPEEYRWSSYGANAWGDLCWLTLHNEYLMLRRDEKERTYAYRATLRHQSSEEDLHLIRKAAHYCQLVGDDQFRAQIEEKYGVVLGQMRRGRPRNTESP